jgi:WD40 repeat protein
MEIITTDDQGFQCRDLRLCLIPDLTSDVDPETPEIKTGLLKVYPNPFNPSTSIVFSIEKDGPVTLAVYDIMGRRVRLLIDGKETEAGVHTVPWDGRGDDGGRVSSGIYLCRLLAGGRASAMKAILLR